MARSKGVHLKNITKVYVSPNSTNEFKAVDNISIDIEPGEFVTLLGPSGCGKTTTLRMIAGFEIPTQGDIFLGRDKVNTLTPDKRDTAMVFQSYAIFPHLNVYNNIAYGLKLKKLSPDMIKNRVDSIIDLVGLKGMETRAPNQISGGQQQRVALARALVIEPGVLLFDEPLSNLDAKLRVYMRTEIRRIQKEVGITAVYVTHDQSEAMSLSDRIIIMNNGIIEQIGTPMEIYYKPNTRFVSEFIGAANYLEGKIQSVEKGKAAVDIGGVIKTIDYDGSKKTGEYCTAVLRPEAVILGRTGAFPCKVNKTTFMGSYIEYSVQALQTQLNIEVSNPRGKEIFQAGDAAMIDFLPENIHIL